MVRPTEQEKDLQNLQKMSDDEMRPEFVTQMNYLRNRIFKRVKPKLLNGRPITGESLLELCHVYVQSINQGSVPCIESAWSYVCKNECQRALLQVVSDYKNQINQAVSASETPSFAELEQLNKAFVLEA
jgi:hypothetical protein